MIRTIRPICGLRMGFRMGTKTGLDDIQLDWNRDQEGLSGFSGSSGSSVLSGSLESSGLSGLSGFEFGFGFELFLVWGNNRPRPRWPLHPIKRGNK